MSTYTYDDFGITFTTDDDGRHHVEVSCPDGGTISRRFDVPLSEVELERTILALARARTRKAPAVQPGAPAGTREVAVADALTSDDRGEQAVRIGSALADALFDPGIGGAYDEARRASVAARRGLRLTLTLGDAPELLNLPWEFLYRRPRFLASHRHTPLVRRLQVETFDHPPDITERVRILGVVAAPRDLTPLDSDQERRRVEQAVAPMVDSGRIELQWLEPATPRSLRRALRDSRFHVLHYVGHSAFSSYNEGALFLEDDHGGSAPVDSRVLANLLADETGLRLVVLNSCEGARTTLHDPYAGVATTLIQLGVPAVVAMQFEISDPAAITFAEELYTNLIGRQDPIDASVAEARKAIYVEVDPIEWATPVLFVRDPDVRLFDFRVAEQQLPPPPPPGVDPDLEPNMGDVSDESAWVLRAEDDQADVDETAADDQDDDADEPQIDSLRDLWPLLERMPRTPPSAPPLPQRRRPTRFLWRLVFLALIGYLAYELSTEGGLIDWQDIVDLYPTN